MKALIEKRNDLIEEMEGLVAVAQKESRSLATEEVARVTEVRTEIANIDATLKLEEETRAMTKPVVVEPTEVELRAQALEKEERAFVAYIRGDQSAETRAALSVGGQGVVIPKAIAAKIVDKVVNLSPILGEVEMYNFKGDLVIPTYDYTQHIPAGYYTEMAVITGSNADFGSVTLTNNIVVALSLISKSLINRADVDVVPFIVNAIGKALAHFLERELVATGTGAGKLNGLATIAAGQITGGATTLVITPQELINLQLKVPQSMQGGAKWLMHPTTYGYLAGLTAGAGNNTLLLGNNLAEGTGFSLLGKPVLLSDNMPVIAVNALEIFYGDFSGVSMKIVKDVEIQVLNERYADTYSVGVLASLEADAKITEPQKFVAYKGK
ncbi:phage major capsid protein [Paenibacillus sp. OV219]|uniref:phage major capsid protein n=1 Tax=Paenibacillus sp. OV219 TaxID=1884377 RepID=UPI0008D51C83|nr:phage major capsid protein [Paenibacillus sp. OV219]SEN19019.1 phage major capsid protein, HK97 family [Paenibacillus sp. OV219]